MGDEMKNIIEWHFPYRGKNLISMGRRNYLSHWACVEEYSPADTMLNVAHFAICDTCVLFCDNLRQIARSPCEIAIASPFSRDFVNIRMMLFLTYLLYWNSSSRDWQRSEGLLLVHSSLSSDSLIALSIFRFGRVVKSTSLVGWTQFSKTLRTRQCQLHRPSRAFNTTLIVGPLASSATALPAIHVGMLDPVNDGNTKEAVYAANRLNAIERQGMHLRVISWSLDTVILDVIGRTYFASGAIPAIQIHS